MSAGAGAGAGVGYNRNEDGHCALSHAELEDAQIGEEGLEVLPIKMGLNWFDADPLLMAWMSKRNVPYNPLNAFDVGDHLIRLDKNTELHPHPKTMADPEVANRKKEVLKLVAEQLTMMVKTGKLFELDIESINKYIKGESNKLVVLKPKKEVKSYTNYSMAAILVAISACIISLRNYSFADKPIADREEDFLTVIKSLTSLIKAFSTKLIEPCFMLNNHFNQAGRMVRVFAADEFAAYAKLNKLHTSFSVFSSKMAIEDVQRFKEWPVTAKRADSIKKAVFVSENRYKKTLVRADSVCKFLHDFEVDLRLAKENLNIMEANLAVISDRSSRISAAIELSELGCGLSIDAAKRAPTAVKKHLVKQIKLTNNEIKKVPRWLMESEQQTMLDEAKQKIADLENIGAKVKAEYAELAEILPQFKEEYKVVGDAYEQYKQRAEYEKSMDSYVEPLFRGRLSDTRCKLRAKPKVRRVVGTNKRKLGARTRGYLIRAAGATQLAASLNVTESKTFKLKAPSHVNKMAVQTGLALELTPSAEVVSSGLQIGVVVASLMTGVKLTSDTVFVDKATKRERSSVLAREFADKYVESSNRKVKWAEYKAIMQTFFKYIQGYGLAKEEMVALKALANPEWFTLSKGNKKSKLISYGDDPSFVSNKQAKATRRRAGERLAYLYSKEYDEEQAGAGVFSAVYSFFGGTYKLPEVEVPLAYSNYI